MIVILAALGIATTTLPRRERVHPPALKARPAPAEGGASTLPALAEGGASTITIAVEYRFRCVVGAVAPIAAT